MKNLTSKFTKTYKTIFGFFEKKEEIKKEEPIVVQKLKKKSPPAKKIEIPGIKYIVVRFLKN